MSEEKPIFAAGMGYKDTSGNIIFNKAFQPNGKNDTDIASFVKIVSKHWQSNEEVNKTLSLVGVSFDPLYTDFKNGKHIGSCEFLNGICDEKLPTAFICIMYRKKATSEIETALLEDLKEG